MNDQQLDRLISSALGWEADQLAEVQPPLRLAARRLAVRLGPSAALRGERLIRRGPVLGGGPVPAYLLQVLLLALLLLALAAGVLIVGSWLLDRARPDGPRQFGFPADCDAGRLSGEQLLFVSDGESTWSLYPDGRLLSDASAPGPWLEDGPMPARADVVRGTGYLERRLSAAGVELVLQRVTDAGLDEGCRVLRSDEATGAVMASTDGTLVGADWGPGWMWGAFVRELSADEEAILAELVDDLIADHDWLPAEAWIQPEAVLVRPAAWRITVTAEPTGLGPTDELRLPGGGELAGSDPRYEQVVLPGGVDPLEFGELIEPEGGRVVRCGRATRAQAIRLAESIDDLGIGTHSFDPDRWMREEWDGGLFTADLSQAVAFGIEPYGVYIGNAGFPTTCDPADIPPEPSFPPQPSPPPILGGLRDVDPCSLVPDDIESNHGFEPQSGPSRLALDAPANECRVWIGDYLQPVLVTLYSRSVGRARARDLVDNVLGPEVPEEDVGGVAVWKNRCLSDVVDCSPGGAVFSEPYLLIVGAESWMPKADVERLIDGIVERLAAGDF